MKFDPVLIAHYLTKHGSIIETCRELDCSDYQRLARLIRRLLRKEIITRHYVLPIEEIIDPCSVVVIQKNQLTGVPCLGKNIRVIAKFESFAGSPIEVYYVHGDCNEIYEHLDPRGCVIELCSKLSKTMIPIHGENKYTIYIHESKTTRRVFDDIDRRIAIGLFRLSNPPLLNLKGESEILTSIARELKPQSIRYHYYSHVYRHITLNYVYKGGGDYLLIAAWTPDLTLLRKLLETLVASELMTSYWQIHVLTEIPLITIIHGWGFYERFLARTNNHSYIENSSYSIYPVIGVKYE